jgi:hypothetical protein
LDYPVDLDFGVDTAGPFFRLAELQRKDDLRSDELGKPL